MKWINNKKALINGGSYFVCLDYIKDTYDNLVYFSEESDNGDRIIFIDPGFYKWNRKKLCYTYAKVQPSYWIEVRSPITNKLVIK